ncbi:MAG: DUF2997 domain-containing protein [Leptospirales bacterium]|nr:DUF2997 domain-containing protein [Leptospirales bacterium]
MEHHELVIEIAPDGAVKLEVQGVSGPSCMELTKDLELEIGNVLATEKKAEYFSIADKESTANKIKTERS